MDIREAATEMKRISAQMAASAHAARIEALKNAMQLLQDKKEEIFTANQKDLQRADVNGVSEAVKKRLRFDEGKLNDVCAGMEQMTELEDPLGRLELCRELDSGLVLRRVSVPIGVLGVIFEARPDALVQIASLCIKSGNCALLKGGSETRETNAVLFSLMHASAVKAGLPERCLVQADTHSQIDELLLCDDAVDLLIPRGSNAFVRYIMEHTRIPVMGHADGVCHTYVDAGADRNKALTILPDAKLQYMAACNATETLLIDTAYPGEAARELLEMLREKGIRLRGDERAREFFAMEELCEDGYGHEYLDSELSVRFVHGVDEAIAHINRYGSHHTDCIITEDNAAAEKFFLLVDSAGVYHNASTRFADGFRYGFGAEVGISTGKLHARGPVGLAGLCTYKYTLSGQGHIVGDYASGRKDFHFRDISD